MDTSNAVISLREVTKTFDKDKIPVHAIRGISLDFYPKEFTAIVGPSGCGKTTLLNLIGGLLKPTSGSIEIMKTDISSLNEANMTDFRKKNIGFIFQNYNLVPVLNAEENVGLILELLGYNSKEIKNRTDKLLEDVGLFDKRRVRPGFLSGGQQQRVAVARSLASYPKFVLADEPTANLDSASAHGLIDLMQELGEKENMLFIFSTHDTKVIERAKRIIVIEDGKVKSDELNG